MTNGRLENPWTRRALPGVAKEWGRLILRHGEETVMIELTRAELYEIMPDRLAMLPIGVNDRNWKVFYAANKKMNNAMDAFKLSDVKKETE